jgi:N-acetylglucosaminyldiphosphoundecaprenol N-acetyl-beta-D-mannosaminyltransferase
MTVLFRDFSTRRIHLRRPSIMRILDLVAGAFGLLVLGPPLVLLCVLGLRFDVERTLVVGRGAYLIRKRRLIFRVSRLRPLAECLGLARLPDCLSLLRGDICLIGPRPLPPLSPHAVASYRIAMKPGVVSLFALQQWAGVANRGEADVDYDYATAGSWKARLGLLVRTLRAAARGVPRVSPLSHISVDGVRIDNLSSAAAVARILQFLEKGPSRQVSFVNADRINQAARDQSYRQVLRSSDLVLGSGTAVQMFSHLVGEPLRGNVKERDLFARLCEALEGTSHSVYLLGGAPGVAGAAATWIQSRYSECRIAGFDDGTFDASEEGEVIRDIARSGASLLFTAFAAKDQELWIREHLGATGAKVGIGVGRLFDDLSGQAAHAPSWGRRALTNLEFLGRTIRAAFSKRLRAHLPVH